MSHMSGTEGKACLAGSRRTESHFRIAHRPYSLAYDAEIEEQRMPILPAENEEESSEPGHSAARKKGRAR